MSPIVMNRRMWILTIFLLLGFTVCIAPAAAETAWLEIDSIPSGAWACIDHMKCNETPVTFAIDSNSYHALSVYKEGYQVSDQTVHTTLPWYNNKNGGIAFVNPHVKSCCISPPGTDTVPGRFDHHLVRDWDLQCSSHTIQKRVNKNPFFS